MMVRFLMMVAVANHGDWLLRHSPGVPMTNGKSFTHPNILDYFFYGLIVFSSLKGSTYCFLSCNFILAIYFVLYHFTIGKWISYFLQK